MNSETRVYLSDRNLPLAYAGTANLIGVISVEASRDWHDLFLVKNNAIYRIDADGKDLLRHNGVPNPASLAAYALSHGYEIDAWSLQMIVGRFTLTTQNLEHDAELALFVPTNLRNL
jgi:hypothetical protein